MNEYKEGSVMTCDECSKKPKNKILLRDDHGYIFCTECWPYEPPEKKKDTYLPKYFKRKVDDGIIYTATFNPKTIKYDLGACGGKGTILIGSTCSKNWWEKKLAQKQWVICDAPIEEQKEKKPLLNPNKIYEFNDDRGVKFFTYLLGGTWDVYHNSPNNYEQYSFFTEGFMEERFFDKGDWKITDSYFIPEGYKFRGVKAVPKKDMPYIFTGGVDNTDGKFSMCRGKAVQPWYLLEEVEAKKPLEEWGKEAGEKMDLHEIGLDIRVDWAQDGCDKTVEGDRLRDNIFKQLGSLPPKFPLTNRCTDAAINAVIKTKSEEDNNMSFSKETDNQVFTSDVNGNVKFLRGYVEANISKERALDMLSRAQTSLHNLREGTGADTLFIKEKIATLEKEEEALIAILNDKKRS